MASIAKVTPVSISTPSPDAEHSLSGLYAGEAIAAGDACYVKTSDGKLWRSIGTSANAAARVIGFAAQDAAVGDPLTLYYGVRFQYGSGLTPGIPVYLDTTAGGLSDAATTGGTTAIGYIVDTTRIELMRSFT